LVENATKKANSGKTISMQMIQGYSKLNENITNTINLIEDVETSSKEQQVGIEQINNTVQELDKKTQQNAQEASNITSLASKIDTLSKDLDVVSSNAKFDFAILNQTCDVNLQALSASLKHDHIKFKDTNYAKLNSTGNTWNVTTYNTCNLGKWIMQSEQEAKSYTKTANWSKLKNVHENVHTGVQNLINANSTKASNDILNRISTDIEVSISEIFDMLDTVKVNNCKQ